MTCVLVPASALLITQRTRRDENFSVGTTIFPTRLRTGRMLSSQRCGAKTRSLDPASHHPTMARSAAACTGARWGQAPRETTRTRSSMAVILARLLRNVSTSAN